MNDFYPFMAIVVILGAVVSALWLTNRKSPSVEEKPPAFPKPNPPTWTVIETLPSEILTEKEVMDILDLRPWPEIEKAALETSLWRGGDFRRRSGRTTKMLVQAVVLASEGNQVHIEGHTQRYELELQLQAREYCKKCGVDPKRIIGGSSNPGKPLLDTVMLVDHHVWEELAHMGSPKQGR